MFDPRLAELAHLAGLATEWIDIRGETRTVPPETLRAILAAFGLPANSEQQVTESLAVLDAERKTPTLLTGLPGQRINLPFEVVDAEIVLEAGASQRVEIEAGAGKSCLTLPAETGYHRLRIGKMEIVLAVAPTTAWNPDDIAPNARIWGSAAQIYSLNDGRKAFGDFGDVAKLAVSLAAYEADLLALSPAHALFSALPDNFGPYSPSTRLLLNPLYVPVEDDAPVSSRAPHDLIDWPSAAAAKMALLRRDYEHFVERSGRGEKTEETAFAAFVAKGGAELLSHARFEALHGDLLPQAGADWRKWPEAHRLYQPAGSAWSGEVADRVNFHLYLQWRADTALAAAQRAATDAGMRVGIVTDMAVGVDPAGSHGWSSSSDLLSGITIGAPPDLLNEIGQSWGLATLSPRALRQSAFRPFLATVRRAMRHAGGVRIDHALGLQRLWVVPPGGMPTDGTYLANPFEDLLRLICLESRRHRAIVIGEDLGNVPPGFQTTLARHGILGMRPLWFEKDPEGRVKRPAAWDRAAVALTTTHDLPTVAGWWSGRDLVWRRQLFPTLESKNVETERAAARSDLWEAIGGSESMPDNEDTEPVVDNAVSFIAQTSARIALIPMEDIVGSKEQPNVPGTIDTHPNWRRRLPPGNGLDDGKVRHRLAKLARMRPRS